MDKHHAPDADVKAARAAGLEREWPPVSILLPDGAAPRERDRAPDYFTDLNLDQIVAAATADKTEYGLGPLYFTPSDDPAVIAFRHEVMRDLAAGRLRDDLEAFASAMRAARDHLGEIENFSHPLQRARWFLDAANLYWNGVTRLSDRLAAADLSSRGLIRFRSHLAAYVACDSSIAAITQGKRLAATLSAIRYDVLIDGLRVQVRDSAREADYGVEVEKTFAEFTQGVSKDYSFELDTSNQLNSVEGNVLSMVGNIFHQTFAEIEQYKASNIQLIDRKIAQFDREVQFYISYIQYIDRLKRGGLEFCFPSIVSAGERLLARRTFDLALAGKLMDHGATPVCNDFSLKRPERILVVSGPNQGGKTTFARCFGQLHHLAGLGLPVPGAEAQIQPPDRIFTHFGRVERMMSLRGKLQDDLVRVRNILQAATPRSLLVFNEIFASTTLQDAISLGEAVALQVRAVDALCVWVTFIDEVAALGETVVSLVSEVGAENPTARTFKIVRRPPGGLAHAMSIAEKHCLTYAAIKARLARPDRDADGSAASPGNESALATDPASASPFGAMAGKARLLHVDRDFDWSAAGPWNAAALAMDLALASLLGAMAGDDERILDCARRVILAGMTNDIPTILHRQGVLKDCLARPAVIRELYEIATEAAEIERRRYLGSLARQPEWVLNRSIDLMGGYLTLLKRLRKVADRQARGFTSAGWTAFFDMTRREFDDSFFRSAEAHLEALKFRRGMMLSAGLGKANKAARLALHRPFEPAGVSWWERLLDRIFPRKPPPNSFDINPRDESGIRALEDVRKRGITGVSRSLALSADHVLAFFNALRAELAFYVGCLNLHDKLAAKGETVCIPLVSPPRDRRLTFLGLYDVSLSLTIDKRAIPNDADLDQRSLVIVTGANQGGKSTFLRGIGLAQLMTQSGMFAPARAFHASLHDGLVTHYTREEDASMSAGKFDEELCRMSDIIDHMTDDPMILFNEPFAATNEREGSEVAGQVLSALLERPVTMICVTHLFELATRLHDRRRRDIAFLRADRREDGARTFKLIEGEPLPTSFGADLYRNVFGRDLRDKSLSPDRGAA